MELLLYALCVISVLSLLGFGLCIFLFSLYLVLRRRTVFGTVPVRPEERALVYNELLQQGWTFEPRYGVFTNPTLEPDRDSLRVRLTRRFRHVFKRS